VEEQTDSTFIKNISIITVLLVVFTIVIIFLARDIGFKEEQGDGPGSVGLTQERIKPVGGAYTGEAGAAALEQAATQVTTEKAVAFDGSLDAEMIYKSVCAVCHTTGAAGAPQPALNGLNAMPARGGRSDLTDEQVQVAIEFMIK
jgi:cytochrome c5